MRASLCWTAMSTAIVLLGPAVARACPRSDQNLIATRQVIPADGSANVPTNVQVVVAYTESLVDNVQLVSDGQVVATAMVTPFDRRVVLGPILLRPATRYQVLSEVAQLPCSTDTSGSLPACRAAAGVDGGAMDGGQPLSFVISTFTTGTGPDATPPVLTGELRHTQSLEPCAFEPCQDTYVGIVTTFEWNAASDDAGVAGYELLTSDGAVAVRTGATKVAGETRCSPSLACTALDFTSLQPGTYQVVAVALAGNRSLPIATNVSVDCNRTRGANGDGGGTADPSSQDAAVVNGDDASGGTETRVDAGAADAVAIPKQGDGCSCQLAWTGGNSGLLAGLPALIWAAVGRRRRRSFRHGSR